MPTKLYNKYICAKIRDYILGGFIDMVRAIMHGCNGRMGQVITGLVKMIQKLNL